MKRRLSRQVRVGNVLIGGGAPIVVQSMTNTDTEDVQATARQVEALAAAGSELVRITVNTPEAAAQVPRIRDRSGKAIFSQLNRPGTEQRVNGRPPLAVVVGNAHAVRLTYDERPVNLAQHTKVDVARLTLQ